MLQITNLRKSFREPEGGELAILDVPEFSVAAGEQMVLVGKSGSGKTTLLHIIAGIATADSGSVLLDGDDLVKMPEWRRDQLRANKVGYVFQTFNLLDGFTALENVLLGMAFGTGGYDRPRAEQLLDSVGLSHRLNHVPNKLSVGEQQRVAVARALANRPRLLLADEPTANVDPANQQSIIDLLRTTCSREGVAMILVTHSLEVAGQFPRVVRLEEINRVGRPSLPAAASASAPMPAPAPTQSGMPPDSLAFSTWWGASQRCPPHPLRAPSVYRRGFRFS